MNFLKLTLLFLVVFFGIYFLLSLVGMLWCTTYYEVVSNVGWLIVYSMFIGWWVAGACVVEYNDKNNLGY